MVKINKLLLLSVITLTSYASNAELIGSWSLNGHLQDSSGYGQHGESFISSGSAATANQATPEVYVTDFGSGQSLVYDFDNSNYIALNSHFNAVGALPEFSASAWFKTDVGFADTLVSADRYGNWAFIDFDRSEYFNLFVEGNGSISFSTTAANSSGAFVINDMISQRKGLNDGQWHHVGVSYSEVDGKQIFIDRQLDSTIGYLGAVGTGNLRYGFIGDGSEATTYNGNRNNLLFDGSISDVNLWDNKNDFSIGSVSSNITVPAPASLGLLSLALFGLLIRKTKV